MKKYIRYIFSLLCCIALSTAILITASAHPGGTNADGGHWDYDAGEYHYHHGYPAHDHYDSNGDGIVDCPYDFDDQTGINSGSPSSGGTNSRSYSFYDYDPPETITVYKDREVIKEVPYTPSWIKWVLRISLFLCMCFFISCRSRKRRITELEAEIDKQKNQFEFEKQKLNEDFQRRIHEQEVLHNKQLERQNSIIVHKNDCIDVLESKVFSLQERLESQLPPIESAYYLSENAGQQSLSRIEIPNFVYFNDHGIPVKGDISEYMPFGEFTVFITGRSTIYHSERFCGSAFSMKPIHIYDVIDTKRPCFRCGKYYGNECPKWYTQIKEFNKERMTMISKPADGQMSFLSED